MQHSKVVFLVLALAAVMTVSFQNCSQVKFSSPSQNSISAAGTPDPVITIRSLEPTLAVRGFACIECHGNLASNIVTDFGFGDAFYFGRNRGGPLYGNGSAYSDHMQSFKTLTIASDKQVFVPKAALPADIAADTKLNTLSDYLKAQLAQAADAGTRAVQVKELDQVYIGAPTENDLRTAFSFTNGRMKFIKSKTTDLSGLSDRGTFFQNTDVLKCDGDLIIQGPLYLKDLQLQTESGCRLYVIGSVFAYGAITFINSSDLRNFQITATRSISFGLGRTTKDDGSYCLPNGYLATNTAHGTNTMVDRYVNMWTVPGANMRSGEDPTAFGQTVISDAKTIENGIGETLMDAECTSAGRQISFERLLLNAPVVMSRYNGDVRGTIVAEFALMSLGQFKFEFDPVFKNVDVLPKLAQSVFIGTH